MDPEIERIQREFGWNPELFATWNSALGFWQSADLVPNASTYSDERWNQWENLLDNSWWFRTRNLILADCLSSLEISGSIWDFGCGNGLVTQFFQRSGYSVIGVEPSYAGASSTSNRGVTCFCANFADLALPNQSISAVSILDVLEHLPNRKAALDEIFRTLKPGGLLIVTVPALRLLWSQFDEENGHFLRYNKRSIRRELRVSGFEIDVISYFFLLTLFPLLLLRSLPYRLGLRQAVATEATHIASGGRVGRVASWIERRCARYSPIGSSLLIVAHRPA